MIQVELFQQKADQCLEAFQEDINEDLVHLTEEHSKIIDIKMTETQNNQVANGGLTVMVIYEEVKSE